MQNKAILSLITLMTLILGPVFVLSLVVTNPKSLGPIGVTAWFLALLVGLACGLTLLLFNLKRVTKRYDPTGVRLSASWRQGFLIASLATVCLALSSLRQFSLRDGVLLFILAVLIEFYFRTRS